MITGSDDMTARLWDLRTLDAIRKDPMKYACERIGQGFAPSGVEQPDSVSAVSGDVPSLTEIDWHWGREAASLSVP
jgi:hypothetical protein